jgi:hypothetical protein
MELAKINNYIKLINDMNIEELLRVLEFDRQQAIMEEKGKTYKLATAVKKVIDIKQLKKERPALASIMHDKDGKQFICDGYMLIKWNDFKEELNGFLQTDYDKSIKIESILPLEHNTFKHELTEEETLLIQNIDKYIKIYKNETQANEILPIKLFNRLYSASLIKKAFDIIGEIKTYNTTDNRVYTPIYIYGNGIKSVLLPIRIVDETKTQEAETMTQEFLKKLKGE